MKKIKIISFIVVVLLLGSLIIYASTHHYEDSHLRLEGKRVRVPENSFLVDNCSNTNAVYCEKIIEVNGEKEKLTFEFKDIKDNGYPKTFVAKINGKEFYKKSNLNIEEDMYIDFQSFLNFKVMGDYILFTVSDGEVGLSTILYAIDKDGNVILKEKDFPDDMKIKDSAEFITYSDNTVTLYTTKLTNDYTYDGKDICEADAKEIIEAYYTYTLKNGKFTRNKAKEITVKEHISNKDITCSEES